MNRERSCTSGIVAMVVMIAVWGCGGGGDGDDVPEECEALWEREWVAPETEIYRPLEHFMMGVRGDGVPYIGMGLDVGIVFLEYDGSTWVEERTMIGAGVWWPSIAPDGTVYAISHAGIEVWTPYDWEQIMWEERPAETQTRYADLVWDEDGTLFVTYQVTGEDGPVVVESRGADGTWTGLGTLGTSGEVGKTGIALDPTSGHPVVAFADMLEDGELRVMRWESGTMWTDLGLSGLGSNGNVALAVSAVDGAPVVVAGGGSTAAVRWSGGTSWTDLGTMSYSGAEVLEVVLDADDVPVVLHGNESDAMRWTGGTSWELLDCPIRRVLEHGDMKTDDDGRPVVAWSEELEGDVPKVARLETDGTWTELGVVQDAGADDMALTFHPDDGAPVLLYEVPTNEIHLRKWEIGSATWVDIENPVIDNIGPGQDVHITAGGEALAASYPRTSHDGTIRVGGWGVEERWQWEETGVGMSEGPCSKESFAFDSQSRLVFADDAGRVLRWDGTSWDTLREEVMDDIETPHIAIGPDDMPVVAISMDADDQDPLVLGYTEAGTWEDISPTGCSVVHALAVDGEGRPVLGVDDLALSREGFVSVLRWNGDAWDTHGYHAPSWTPELTFARMETFAFDGDGDLHAFYRLGIITAMHHVDDIYAAEHMRDDTLWCEYGVAAHAGNTDLQEFQGLVTDAGVTLTAYIIDDGYWPTLYLRHNP